LRSRHGNTTSRSHCGSGGKSMIDLIATDPPKYGLGYWLAKEATGRGYARAALRALIGHARTELSATDIYAGVTRGNAGSEGLLERVGFLPVLDFDSYRRFHLGLR
jgi:RimJ/RimL family protein N-acetyltransferase